MSAEKTQSPQATVTVVIPYFQRREGILARALASIAAQRDVDLESVEVIVVDDASPIPASTELPKTSQPFRVRVTEQANGGPGAARNAGLNSLSASTKFVAFLDSDDVWADDHLSVAIATLEASGASFFFANFFQLGANEPAFQRAGRLNVEVHPSVLGDDGFSYEGDMAAQIFTGNVIGTSTVVYRFDMHPRLRFRPEYRRAGEDYLMWMDFVKDGATFAFRWSPSVTYLEGINVYSGARWGSVELLERTQDEVRYLSAALGENVLSEALKSSLAARIAEKRAEYWRAFPAVMKRHPLAAIRHLLKR